MGRPSGVGEDVRRRLLLVHINFEGRLQNRSWDGQDGQKRYATEIVANDMIMLDRRQAAGVASGQGGEDVEETALDGDEMPF